MTKGNKIYGAFSKIIISLFRKPFEGRMPPQGQAYPNVGPPGQRYMGQMYPQKSHHAEEDSSEGWQQRPKDEKSVAAERAKRRREEEEKRWVSLELQKYKL